MFYSRLFRTFPPNQIRSAAFCQSFCLVCATYFTTLSAAIRSFHSKVTIISVSVEVLWTLVLHPAPGISCHGQDPHLGLIVFSRSFHVSVSWGYFDPKQRKRPTIIQSFIIQSFILKIYDKILQITDF